MSERKPAMKFTQPFLGVPNGQFYPVAYVPGDECPPELEAAAIACGVVEDDKPVKAKGKNAAAA